MKIVCGYFTSNQKIEMDLLDNYLSFHYSYFVAIIVTFIFFSFAWKLCSFFARKISKSLKKEIRHARKPAYWVMLCAILDQDQYPNVSRISFSILSFCFSLFFYLLIDCFMLNTISTDLVVMIEPRVIRNYDDIIKRDEIRVVFLEGMNEDYFFRTADEETDEWKIWQRRQILKSVAVDHWVLCYLI